MYPSLLAFHPDVAESVIEYRRKTIPGARDNISLVTPYDFGREALFFPWNGAGTGDLESECHSWNPPHCLTQIHLQGDIALAVWQYYLATGDTKWLNKHWPLLRGIAEFWAGRVTANTDGTYSITEVAGRTSTPTTSPTACSRTPAPRSRSATPPERRRSSGSPRPQVDNDRRPPADALRRAAPGLPAVQGL